ncbi:hypothetical protein QC760_010448 [Botrytis cinerea]
MGKYYEANPPYYKEKPTKMASMRRIKVFGILVFIAVVSLLFYTSSLRQQRNLSKSDSGDFYSKTMNGLGKQEVAAAGGRNDEDEKVAKEMQQRLKDAADKARDNANAKAFKPDPPSQVGEKEEEDMEVTTELNTILKKSPIIIFSKSYCPHSKRAKDILLEKYRIDPLPYVVELDKHPLGGKLQGRLNQLTGRRTVPNVLVNGVSIGGGDDVAELDEKGTLGEKVKDLGGKKILSVKAN